MKTDKIDIIFLGLAQNCEKHIDKFFDVIIKLSKILNIHVIIGENNSNDYTINKIKEFSIKFQDDFTFIDTTFIEKYDDRIKRLAAARQKLKDNIDILKLRSDYICVVDLDDVLNQNFNVDLILELKNKLKKNSLEYFAMSISSKPFYYDILNFESNIFPNHNIKQIQNNKSIKSYKDRKKFIYDVQKKISLQKNFDCISAFNGFCIYNFDDFQKSQYLENSEDVTPEHLFLNRKIHLITKKKILVTDNYLQMPNEHKPINNIISFFLEKISKYILLFFYRSLKR